MHKNKDVQIQVNKYCSGVRVSTQVDESLGSVVSISRVETHSFPPPTTP